VLIGEHVHDVGVVAETGEDLGFGGNGRACSGAVGVGDLDGYQASCGEVFAGEDEAVGARAEG
jgi:hypothetical protein